MEENIDMPIEQDVTIELILSLKIIQTRSG